MDRRRFVSLGTLSLASLASGCGYLKYLKVDIGHFLIRSPYINSVEQEREIVSRAKVEWTADRRVRVLYLSGSPYEIGYQHGALLRTEIERNIGFLYRQAVKKFHNEEIFAEIYERMRPFIPEEYVLEMQGLAHGSRLPLHIIHAVHILPELGEWGGKKRIKKVIDQMTSGQLATTCSNVSVGGAATASGSHYSVRILDWGLHRISRLHEYPLITVCRPQNGIPYANIGWVGFIGAVSGMNSQGITLGEMGYGDNEHETLFGKPMPFLLRDVMSYASSLADVRKIITESAPTNSFVFLMSDGKNGDAELYVRDPERFVVFKENQEVRDRKEHLPPIPNTVYGGHFNEKMTEILSKEHGKLTPELFMNEIIPAIAMKSNFQNVIYDPALLRFWVNNAASKEEWAASQPYTEFNLGEALKRWK